MAGGATRYFKDKFLICSPTEPQAGAVQRTPQYQVQTTERFQYNIGSGKDGKTGGKGADWLDDDFMMGAKMRNWDRDSDDSDNNGAAIEAGGINVKHDAMICCSNKTIA